VSVDRTRGSAYKSVGMLTKLWADCVPNLHSRRFKYSKKDCCDSLWVDLSIEIGMGLKRRFYNLCHKTRSRPSRTSRVPGRSTMNTMDPCCKVRQWLLVAACGQPLALEWFWRKSKDMIGSRFHSPIVIFSDLAADRNFPCIIERGMGIKYVRLAQM
jgi:hypothetical protein